jgi:hypothetical protein
MNLLPFPAAARLRVVPVLMGAMGLPMMLTGCMQGLADPGSTFRKGVQRDAWRTLEAYDKALLAHRDKMRGDVPAKYWAPRIQELHPIRVYVHRMNLVVVQKVENGMEHGRYVYLPVSPYFPKPTWFPKSGVDGFVFRETVVWDEYHYTRTLGY